MRYQKKDDEIVICSFSDKQAALKSKTKDWLAHSQDFVSKLSTMFICELIF
jgi:hypothetical protein